VDNNYLDLGMNKSGFVHTLPSGRLSGSRQPAAGSSDHGKKRERGTSATTADKSVQQVMLEQMGDGSVTMRTMTSSGSGRHSA
jgi:hypothetical protein